MRGLAGDAAACMRAGTAEAGRRHLVIPSTARWWLDHYVGLHEYLKPALPRDQAVRHVFLGHRGAGPSNERGGFLKVAAGVCQRRTMTTARAGRTFPATIIAGG